MTVRPQGAGGDPRHPAPNGMVAAASDGDRAFSEPIELPKGKKLITLRDAALYITKLPKAEHDAGPADPLSSEMGLDRIGPCFVPYEQFRIRVSSRPRAAFALRSPRHVPSRLLARSLAQSRKVDRKPWGTAATFIRRTTAESVIGTARRPAARGIEGPFPSCEKAHLRERRRVSTTELWCQTDFHSISWDRPNGRPSEAEGSLLEAYLHPWDLVPSAEADGQSIDMKPQQERSPRKFLAGLVERVTFHNDDHGVCVSDKGTRASASHNGRWACRDHFCW